MTVDASTLSQYDGKQVILHVIQADGSVEEKQGKIDGASEFGVAFKEKGKRDVVLVEPNEIEEIDFAPDKPKTLTQKKLRPIADASMRAHLLDRHAFSRKTVNEMTDTQAVEAHDLADHSDLGHRHMTPEEVAKADAKTSEAPASE